MNAYTVIDRNGDEGITLVVFAETRGKALAYAAKDDRLCDYGYTGLRANRCPSLDKYWEDGKKEMDWMNDTDRVAMVKEANFRCSDEVDTSKEECLKCPAYKWCGRGEEYWEDE